MSATSPQQDTIEAQWLERRYREAGFGEEHIAALIAHWRMIGWAQAEGPARKSPARPAHRASRGWARAA